MAKMFCPYLGRSGFANTRMAFPSEDNFCYKAKPAGPVDFEHQAGFCLTTQHAVCPVFLAQAAAPLPAALAFPRSRRPRARLAQRSAVLLAVVLLLFLAGFWLNGSRLATRSMSADNSLAPVGTEGAVPFTGPDAYPASSHGDPRPNRTLSANRQPGLLATRDCPLPRGWQSYTVQPTDSIYRLSIVYAVLVETLQKANCLDNQTALLPGETFYVPVLSPTATSKPTATATPTPTRTRSPFIGSNPTEEPGSGDDDEAQPGAPVVVPTVFRPTQTNPPPTPTEKPVIVPTNPLPTQVVQPTNTPLPTTEIVLPTLPPPTPTQEVQPTLPPPPTMEVVQTTEPAPTKAVKPTKEEKPTKLPQPGRDDNSGVD